MLKFQNNYTTLTGNFEDFILLVYVTVDDLYKKSCSWLRFYKEEIISQHDCRIRRLLLLLFAVNLSVLIQKKHGILLWKKFT